jgi:hypothetical protein
VLLIAERSVAAAGAFKTIIAGLETVETEAAVFAGNGLGDLRSVGNCGGECDLARPSGLPVEALTTVPLMENDALLVFCAPSTGENANSKDATARAGIIALPRVRCEPRRVPRSPFRLDPR